MNAYAESTAANPGFMTKDRAAAEKLATEMNAIAEPGETYEVRDFQANRFIVVMLFNGKWEFTL